MVWEVKKSLVNSGETLKYLTDCLGFVGPVEQTRPSGGINSVSEGKSGGPEVSLWSRTGPSGQHQVL